MNLPGWRTTRSDSSPRLGIMDMQFIAVARILPNIQPVERIGIFAEFGTANFGLRVLSRIRME